MDAWRCDDAHHHDARERDLYARKREKGVALFRLSVLQASAYDGYDLHDFDSYRVSERPNGGIADLVVVDEQEN